MLIQFSPEFGSPAEVLINAYLIFTGVLKELIMREN